MHYSKLAAVSQLFAASLVVAGPVKRQTATTVQSAGAYSYLGCAGDPNVYGGSGRALTEDGTDVSTMTIENCAAYCGASGYQYFGVEYYQQCYCGNTLQPGTTIEADNSNCTLACSGDSTEYCGGNWHLNLYGLPSAGSSSSSGATTSSSSSSSSATSTVLATTSTSITSTTSATSTVPATSSTSSTSTTSAAVSTVTYAGTVQCPASNGTTFTSGTQTYQIQCGVDHNGGDASATYSNSMDDCLAACAAYSGCTDVSWVPGSPGACYIKTSITTGTANEGVWGAVLVSSSSSSSSSSSASSSTASKVSSTSTSTSSVPASTTSSSSKTSSGSSSSSVSKTSTITSAASSTTSSPTTLKTSTVTSTSTTSKASSASSTTTSSAAATTTSAFFSLSTCPSLTVSLGSLLPLNYKFTPYYSGSGYTLNSANPANPLPAMLPAKTYSIAGSNNACAAAQICLNNLKAVSTAYHNIDLHYLSTTSAWECTAYAGFNVLTSYFNVPNSAVTKAYGFNGLLSL